MLDPDPRITGCGIRSLRSANIAIEFFPPDLMSEVEELNREFTRFCDQQNQAAENLTEQTVVSTDRDIKVATILSRGKVVTVVNRPKQARFASESYWPNETIVVDCNPLWVTLKDRNGEQSFALSRVEVNFDNKNKRLRLEIDR
jgi:hypothetical protein